MKRPIRIPNISNHQLPLFYTLLCSFVAIIVLLASIHLASYSFFRNRIKDEIIVNSGLNLNTTATNYEKQFKVVRSFMLGYLFDNDTQVLKSGGDAIRYDVVSRVQHELQATMNNAQLYLDNIIYFFKDTGFVFDRDGTRDASTMFTKFYASDTYTEAFWKGEVEEVDSFRVYPSAVFRMNTAFEQSSHGNLMPILIKSPYDERLAFILLLKSRAVYEAFHQPKPGSNLYILNPDGQVLFHSAPSAELPAQVRAAAGQGYDKVGDTYYFYRPGRETGLLYVEAVADRGLTDQIRQLNTIMLALLGLSILIGLGVSYVIARRFHHPLARLIRSIQAYSVLGGPRASGSRIREYNMLHTTFDQLSRSNEAIHLDLQAKNSMLQQFAYMAKLKKIAAGAALEPSVGTDRPYRIVLVHLEFKARFLTEISSSPHRAFNTYKEVIDLHFSGQYPDSLTFQMERDQILSILFLDEEPDGLGSAGGAAPSAVVGGIAGVGGRERTVTKIGEPGAAKSEAQSGAPAAAPGSAGPAAAHEAELAGLVQLFEADSAYCNFTIAPSPVRTHTTDFAETYQNALDLIAQRRLGEDVQVVTEWRPLPELLIPTPSEETELAANLQAGVDAVTVPLVDKLLDQLEQGGAVAAQVREFAKDVVNRTIKAMYARNVPVQAVIDGDAVYGQVENCHTLEQYKAFFHAFLSRSAAAIQEKKSETDPITKFVIEYVEGHYGGDLSLDALAHKLGITGPYLSSYFKEKTGTNFSDYIYTVRMNKASEMLIETDLLIQEIASLVGYLTVASFNRVFKRYTGMTPSEFRRHKR
ncbi:helix-turn-helix domain-containing protein [Paenibacillus sp. IB182496]|uniref:Helix-turn-helix domain-containing protein n=1 Tax=Paenibacillus sabuli TaxID=2772509 RepID=A0A927BVI3_9BACL|nr:helix-turn-helix domain-containing protein [Paenibacillus sabuli]MBD2847117.1 helix-turn-helix domain-containing protein [Paenibacillus sabuli]